VKVRRKIKITTKQNKTKQKMAIMIKKGLFRIGLAAAMFAVPVISIDVRN
jgi:hypothetical protein